MSHQHERSRYARLPSGSGQSGARARSPFDISGLSVTETVAVCDVDRTPTANVRPNVSVKITQCVRLSDGSIISLDRDRGFTSVWHGSGSTSWKRSAEGLILEVLDLVRVDDGDNPAAHPWDDLAEAARSRGIDVDAPTLRELPYRVLLSDEVISLFEL